MKISASLRLCGILCFSLIVLRATVEGHPSRKVKWEEMHVFRDRIVLFLRYDISEPRFISDLRERFDFDATRSLNPEERNALVEYVQRLATEDIRLRWDEQEIRPAVTLKATSGLERELPSGYPAIFYWQLDFVFPDHGEKKTLHELAFEDYEARWNRPFSCRVRFAPGVQESASEERRKPRIFEFPDGSGSFRINVRLTNDE